MIPKEYLEVCERLDWSVHEYEDGSVDLEKYSPAGEDFIASVESKDFVDSVKAYAASFDIDEHIELWVGNRGKNGVPSRVRELVEDAEAIDKMLQELATALQEAEDDNNCNNGTYDCEGCPIKDDCIRREEDDDDA